MCPGGAIQIIHSPERELVASWIVHDVVENQSIR
jgi:hypothetical protein